MPTVEPIFGFILPNVNDPTDEDQWGGELNQGITTAATNIKNYVDAVKGALFPIGSIYTNASVATNPATLLGFGTWSAFGTGKFVIGAGSGTDVNGVVQSFTAAATGGEYEHTLSVSEMPPHTHTGAAVISSPVTGGPSPVITGTPLPGSNTGSTGGGASHNNLPPYIVCYTWVRTA